MKVAVVFSPGSGKNNLFEQIGQALTQKLQRLEIISCPGAYGGSYLQGCTEVALDADGLPYDELVERIAAALLGRSAELLISVGGDGLASYLAGYIIKSKADVPILGIGAGTANVGPIVSVGVDALNRLTAADLSPENFTYRKIGAVETSLAVDGAEKILGYGFNDVVIGDTFLATVGGDTVNISVADMITQNKKTIKPPSTDICTDSFAIKKSGEAPDSKSDVTAGISVPFSIKKPAQIIASPIEVDNFYGRAVTGALCMSAFSPYKAAVVLTRDVLIDMSSDSLAGTGSFSACEHLLFKPGETISLSGLTENAHVIIDGNPFLNTCCGVVLKYKQNVITLATVGKGV